MCPCKRKGFNVLFSAHVLIKRFNNARNRLIFCFRQAEDMKSVREHM